MSKIFCQLTNLIRQASQINFRGMKNDRKYSFQDQRGSQSFCRLGSKSNLNLNSQSNFQESSIPIVQLDDQYDYQPQKIPKNFILLLQIWNTIKTFSKAFSYNYESFTITEALSIIQDQKKYIKLMANLVQFCIQDLLSCKMSIITKGQQTHYCNILKFCNENSLMDRICISYWPYLMLKWVNIFIGSTQDFELKQFKLTLQKIALLHSQQCVPNFQERLKIAAIGCRIMPETSFFRKLIEKKLQSQKKQKKILMQAMLISKNLEAKAQQFDTIVQYSQIQIDKKEEMEILDQTTKKSENQIGKYQNVHEKPLSKNNQLDKEVKPLQKSSGKTTHLKLLGKDSYQNIYWKIVLFPSWLLINNSNQWFYVHNEAAQSYIQRQIKNDRNSQCIWQTYSLNEEEQNQQIVRSNKNQFYLAIQNFNATLKDKKMGVEFTQERLKYLLTETQSRFSKYLKQRNSRWGNDQQRKQFISYVEKINLLSINQNRVFLLEFNKKICVVESIYQVQFGDKTIKKSRKVQTKLWGVSQKYKNNWIKFCEQLEDQKDLNFCIFVICHNIENYISKNRKNRSEVSLQTVQKQSSRKNFGVRSQKQSVQSLILLENDNYVICNGCGEPYRKQQSEIGKNVSNFCQICRFE